jgi:hypothetical protein
MNCINFNGNKRFISKYQDSLVYKGNLFDVTYSNNNFTYITLVNDFLLDIEEFIKKTFCGKHVIYLYKKRKMGFNIDICTCLIVKYTLEPNYISLHFNNMFVRDTLRKEKFSFPENWKPLTENHYSGVFTFTRSTFKKTKLLVSKKFPKRLVRLPRNIYSIVEE